MTATYDGLVEAISGRRCILFIGYSMSDLNIRLLLHKLWRTWHDSGQDKNRPPSFVFAARDDPVRDAVLEQWGITVLTGEEKDPKKGPLAFLDRLVEDVKVEGAPARA